MATLPKTTQEPIIDVDATPDEGYPLRILKAYRANCGVRWETEGLGKNSARVCMIMNEGCKERARLLDDAIATLVTARLIEKVGE